MPRPVLDESHIHPAIRQRVAQHFKDTLAEVQTAVAAHAVVVVGMRQNPYPRKARKALLAAGVDFHDIEYGSYLSDWRRRTALKMWTGWPTAAAGLHQGHAGGRRRRLDSPDRQR